MPDNVYPNSLGREGRDASATIEHFSPIDEILPQLCRPGSFRNGILFRITITVSVRGCVKLVLLDRFSQKMRFMQKYLERNLHYFDSHMMPDISDSDASV